VKRTFGSGGSARHEPGTERPLCGPGSNGARGSVIATLDAICRMIPRNLPMMLGELASCYMVVAVRQRNAPTHGCGGMSSKFAMAQDDGTGRRLFADSGCNLRAFRASVLPALPAFNGVHRFMPILRTEREQLSKRLPVAHHPRVARCFKVRTLESIGPAGYASLVMVSLFLRRQLKLLGPRSTFSEGASGSCENWPCRAFLAEMRRAELEQTT